MHTATRGRRQTFARADSSRTLIITNDPTQDDSDERHLSSEGENIIIGSLRLRGGHRRRQRVAWGEDVIDNEGCGKKKSKICCIYHKPRPFDESSSEESSDSESENECRRHNHSLSSHPHSDGSSSSSGPPQLQRDGSTVVSRVIHDPDSQHNAYEKQPHSKKGKRRAA